MQFPLVVQAEYGREAPDNDDNADSNDNDHNAALLLLFLPSAGVLLPVVMAGVVMRRVVLHILGEG